MRKAHTHTHGYTRTKMRCDGATNRLHMSQLPLPQPPPPPSEHPPAGWTLQFSKSKNKWYYFNTTTSLSVWDLKDIGTVPEATAQAVAVRVAKPDQPSSEPVLVSLDFAEIEANNFRSMVRSRLQAFCTCANTALEFEPCSKELRNVIHEEALDLALISASKGDDEERFVAVYKKGFEPDEDAVVAAPVVVAAAPVKRKPKRAEAPPPPTDDLEILGVVKRDRRTIEEVEAEIKRSKR